MARLTTQLVNFNGGEVSPLMDARIDLDFYASTSKKLRNYIPLPQGPLTRRNGQRYIATCKGGPSRLWPFIFATGDAYMLEFGANYVRFYQDQAQVAGPLEVATPYAAGDLFQLQFAQVGDLLYITHGSYPPANISRTSLTPTFTYAPIQFMNGPTLDENNTLTTLQASATTGTVTITSSDPFFNAAMVGGIWAISEPTGSLGAYAEWAPATVYTASTYVRTASGVYFTTAGGTSGNITPSHNRGTVSDGGVLWLFINNGTGYISFDTYISATQFSGVVQLTLPSTAVGAPTLFWNEGAWSGDQGYPGAITFYDQRAYYAGTAQQPQTIWGSKTNGKYEDFDTGSGLDDDSLVFTVATNEVDTINWLAVKTVLLAGTKGGVFVAKASSLDQLITPSNVQIKKNISTSCSSLAPILVNNTLFFTHRAERKILGASYNFEQDSFVAEDFTIRAEHVTLTGVKDIDYQQEPHSIVWCVLNGGELAGLTIEQGQKVAGWHRHNTNHMDFNGDIIQDSYESVATIPTSTTDELWVIVNRTMNGVTKRFVELVEPDDTRLYYVDAGKYYFGSSVAAGLYGGFSHLANMRVKVMLISTVSTSQSFAVTVDQTVNSSGQIVLPYDCTGIIVGLPYFSDYLSCKLNLQLEDGNNFSKPTRPYKVSVRLLNTLGLQIGFNEDSLQDQPFRRSFDLMDNPPPQMGNIFAEDYEITFNGTWDPNNPTIYLRQSQPLPSTIISLSIQLDANTR